MIAFPTIVPSPGGWYVYAYFDVSGKPLYVGYTGNPRKRIQSQYDQRSFHSWYARAVRYSLVRFESPWRAREMETRVIHALHPVGNRQCHGCSAASRARRMRVMRELRDQTF